MNWISRAGDALIEEVDSLAGKANEMLFEPVIRVGVTGLARSGKTVFITSLVANLLERGRMGGFRPVGNGRIEAVWLEPQPDQTIPRFSFEEHLRIMTGAEPQWPESTRAVSELRLTLKLRPRGMFGAVRNSRKIHIDIVDYPGEWLLDLGLIEKNYWEWSSEALARLAKRDAGKAYLELLSQLDPEAILEEEHALKLAQTFTAALHEMRDAGYSDCSPGRFLLPGDMEGAPALTFAPLPASPATRRSYAKVFSQRYEAYKRGIIRPFFRRHFSRLDRQIVLVDLLGALAAGPAALLELGNTMEQILSVFRVGQSGLIGRLLGEKRVDRILFAASKADHLHHSQHSRLGALLETLLAKAKRRASFKGAKTKALAIASLRSTVEESREVEGQIFEMVRAHLRSGEIASIWPGALPENPNELFAQDEGSMRFLAEDYAQADILPAPLTLRPGEGPPHLRLDQAAEFLLGDRL